MPLSGQPTAPMHASIAMHKVRKKDASVPVSTASSGCWTLITDEGQKFTTLQGLWSTMSGVRKFMTYKTKATTSSSIAISVSDGAWTTAGVGNTSVTQTGGSQSFPELTGMKSRLGQTEMEIGFFEPCQISVESAVFPYAVNGGAHYVKANPPKAKFCVNEPKGSKITLNKTESYKFTNGINLKSVIGLNLATVTGYSDTASIKYQFTANGFACGTKNFPLRKSPRGVVADASRTGNR